MGRLAVVLLALLAPAEGAIRHIDLIHLSHTDFGFTDHPSVVREMQIRYLDIALDAPDGLRWTAETTDPVADWWARAPAGRREAFLRAVQSGKIEVAALPLNNTPFLSRAEWFHMLHWLPEDLWNQVKPRAAVQNDVNGFPRAGALALLDRGIRYLWTGINNDSGGAPFERPSGFWWKMPDGRRLLVWLSLSYPAGYDLFEAAEWRRGPVPPAADTRYRPPREGDFLRAGEASVRAAHRRCLERLRRFEAAGYPYETVALSITNQWRIDNDPPLPLLADFVAAWNRLGLQPSLRLTTVSVAMERLEKEIGGRLPTYTGEWTDWWANGTGSAPREVAASRAAKRFLAAALSNVWGEPSESALRTAAGLYKQLCLFDEHTWGSANSVALPDSLDSQGQFNEKARLAYRPMALAEWLLSQRVRTRLSNEPEGLYVVNTTRYPVSDWIEFPITAFREKYQSVEGAGPIEFLRGMQPWTRPRGPEDLTRENLAATFPDNVPDQVARFWVDHLTGIRRLRLSAAAAAQPATENRVTLRTGRDAWPVSAQWQGMPLPLFLPGMGDLLSVRVSGFAPRWIIKDIWGARSAAERDRLRMEKLIETPAAPEGNAETVETPYTMVYTQALRHPALRWATRRLEVWKTEPRARLTFRFDRASSDNPEIYFIAFPLPAEGTLPRASAGGQPFIPFEDQLPGTCRDYFAIDGWVDYPTPNGHWLWVSRDAPLVTFGDPAVLARRTQAPPGAHRIMAMVFNNFWYTNFVGNSHGVMEYQFDLIWRKAIEDAGGLAESLVTRPVVLINPALRENPVILRDLFRP